MMEGNGVLENSSPTGTCVSAAFDTELRRTREEVIRRISAKHHEPQRILDRRLEAFRSFLLREQLGEGVGLAPIAINVRQEATSRHWPAPDRALPSDEIGRTPAGESTAYYSR
jgi:hypothetical protein